MERQPTWVTAASGQPNSRDAMRRFGRFGRFVIGTVALSLGWSAVALGASTMGVDCDHSGADFLDPGTESHDLAISAVDLTSDKNTVIITAAPSDSAPDSNTGAPLLFLTPRVESIVDDVFHADNIDVLANEAKAETGTTMTPLAETGDEPIDGSSEPIESERPLDTRPLMPSIQRQMYRTDI